MKLSTIFVLLLLSVFIVSCATPIKDVKLEENVGKTVVIKGTVESSFKIGSLSGYSVKDDTDKITVSSSTLPKEGEKVTVKGVLIKDSLLGYYIKE